MKAMVQGWRVPNAPAIYLSTAPPEASQYCYSAEGSRDTTKFDARLKNTEMENAYRFPFRLVGRKSSKAATHLNTGQQRLPVGSEITQKNTDRVA
jgi:hypothetical protein